MNAEFINVWETRRVLEIINRVPRGADTQQGSLCGGGGEWLFGCVPEMTDSEDSETDGHAAGETLNHPNC